MKRLLFSMSGFTIYTSTRFQYLYAWINFLLFILKISPEPIYYDAANFQKIPKIKQVSKYIAA